MTIGSIGKALASQAIESTKSTVIDAVRQPEPAKPAETKPAIPQDTGTVILGQIQAMQRPLKDDQELMVTFRAGDEMLRVTEIFVPNPQVLVFAGVDKEGHVTRVISPVDSSQVTCKVMPVTPGFNAIRVNVLTPKPQPKPAA